MRKGSQIVLDCLRAEGVDLVFGYPGGAIMPLYDALDGSSVRHILTRHEQGAVFAAEGYARSTGKVGVAMATSGPGATNLITGIADAKMDSVPLVCITGQVRSALIGTDAFQETDVFGMTLSLTKWNRLVRSIEEIPEVIAQGFYWARSGRPGPVMIDIPVDMLKASMEFNGPVKFTPPRPAEHVGSESTFATTLIALLQQAKKPVALVQSFRARWTIYSKYLICSRCRRSPPFTGWARSSKTRPTTSAWSACTERARPTWRSMRPICCWFLGHGWMIV